MTMEDEISRKHKEEGTKVYHADDSAETYNVVFIEITQLLTVFLLDIRSPGVYRTFQDATIFLCREL